MTSNDDSAVAVIQADREAAVRIMEDRWHAPHRREVLAGQHDTWTAVVECARHRLASKPVSAPSEKRAREVLADAFAAIGELVTANNIRSQNSPSGDLAAVVAAMLVFAAEAGAPVVKQSLTTADDDPLDTSTQLVEPAVDDRYERLQKALPSYSEQELADCCIDFLEERADEWMAEIGVQRMFNAIASVFEKYAPQEHMDRFRKQLGVIGRQCHVEGALRVWEEIAAQQRALGTPLPANPKIARAALSASEHVAGKMVLVPREPTQDMCDAATEVMIDDGRGRRTTLNWSEAAEVWSAMLAAAQPDDILSRVNPPADMDAEQGARWGRVTQEDSRDVLDQIAREVGL